VRRSKGLLAILALALCALGFGVTAATADAPEVTAPQVSDASYTTAQVEGEVDPKGEFTEWFFEVSTNGTDWERTNVAGGIEGSGLQTVPPDSSEGVVQGLKPGTHYEIRLSAMNYTEFVVVSSPEPNPEFTTKSLPAPTVSIDPVTTFAGTTATFSGEINPNAPAGNPAAADVNWHFQCTPECPNVDITSSPTPNPVPADTANHAVSGEATGLEPNTTYEVTLVGENAGDPVSDGPVSFKTATVAPDAETIPAYALASGTEAQLGGRINPKNSPTTWWIEWGTTASYGNSTPHTESAGEGGAEVVKAKQIGGLTPGTTYHFQIVAENGTGQTPGEDMTFTTPQLAAQEPTGSECPNAEFRAGPSASLPECRAYELVSRPDMASPVAALRGTVPGARTVLQPWSAVAPDGDTALWEVANAQPGDDSSGMRDIYRSRRGTSGWSSTMVSPPGSKMYNAYEGASPMWASPDLDHILYRVIGTTIDPTDQDVDAEDLDKPSSFNFKDIYRGDPDGTFTRITQGSLAPPVTSESVNLIGSSADGQTVTFESDRALEPGALPGGENIYVRKNGVTTLVSKDENDVPISAVGFASSEDGSVVVFGTGEDLYIRDRGLTRTVHLQAFPYGMGFESLSPDGSRLIFFTDKPMTGDDSDSSVDLYEYDDTTGAISLLSKPEGSTGTGPGNTDACAGSRCDVSPVAVSRDGSKVYFVSPEQLDGNKGTDGGANMYLTQGGTLRFVATIDRNDPDFGLPGSQGSALGRHVRLTPDASKLLFESRARVTGYDNAGYTEIYLYDSATGGVSCVSCRPDGTPPIGDSSLREGPTFESSNEPMYPANSDEHGEHIFFHSADTIVPGDGNAKYDVYEHDVATGETSLISAGTSASHSLYLGNGVDGKDVLFFTTDTLSPQDRNGTVYKLYDARVDGGFPTPPLPPAPCEGEGCRGGGSAKPTDIAPTTESFVGPGNPKAKHKKHKKHKHKKHSHKHHKKHHGKSQKRHANRDGRTDR
jgi:hypothetical protein